MHWELWAIPTMNMIGSRATEHEMLDLVRELMNKDWRPDELSLIVEDESVPDEALPPAITGNELARLAGYSDTASGRRTA
jgi:hypothetical protein